MSALYQENKTDMIVSAIQLNGSEDIAENLKKLDVLIKEAAKKGAKIVVLPENFAFIGSEKKKAVMGAEICEKATEFLSQQAQKNGIHLVGGGHPVPSGGYQPEINLPTVYNASVVYSPKGEEVARYYKVHLFTMNTDDGVSEFDETLTHTHGKGVTVVPLDGGVKLGLSICYDLRFPELYRELALFGANVITVTAAFLRETGKAHFELLCRTRAVENQCYLIVSAQTGEHPRNRKSYGHSMIINPWGDVVAKLGEEEGIITASVDIKSLEELRNRMPVLQNRRM